MLVEDLMTRDVSVCTPDTNAAAAAEIMWVRNCGFLPVLEESGKLAGIVTDRDLFIALGTRDRRPSELTVGEAMQREPAVCAPDDDVRSAMRSMAARAVPHLFVVDQSGTLRGVLSTNDVLLRISSGTGAAFRGDVIRTLQAIGGNRQLNSAQARHATA